MKSSLRILLAATFVATLLASPAFALEKSSQRLSDTDRADIWRGSSSCTLQYYNICTGWIWIWSGFAPSAQFGVSFTSCCTIGYTTGVGAVWSYFYTGAPSGYSFTGTIDVFDADASQCPTGAAIASQAFLPVTGWNSTDFGGIPVPDRTFAVAVTFGAGASNPAAVASDHPAGVGAEAPACGTCYPIDRANHSFDYGTTSAPLCPGSSFNDGVCDAQLLIDADVSCAVSVEQNTWGAVKALYR